MGKETTLSIRLHPATDPISGVVIAEGSEREFSGWIQLVGLIESLRPLARTGPEGGRPDVGSRLPEERWQPEAPPAS